MFEDITRHYFSERNSVLFLERYIYSNCEKGWDVADICA